tara:strand:+ start:507 stop:677 length:171 start_codon:yes stop_codon:yes gene_type:complete
MQHDILPDLLEEDQEEVEELIECRNCEARFRIVGDDILYEDICYCPFCGEYMMRSY